MQFDFVSKLYKTINYFVKQFAVLLTASLKLQTHTSEDIVDVVHNILKCCEFNTLLLLLIFVNQFYQFIKFS